MIRKTLILGALVATTLLALAAPAFGWHATARCGTVLLDAGRDDMLGRTVVVYADGKTQRLDIDAHKFVVDNAGPHGHVILVRFSNGESVELAQPVGCTPETSTTAAVVPAEPSAVAAVAPETVTAPAPVTTATVAAAEELPRTGETTTTFLIWGTAFLVVGLAGVCFVGNRSWRAD